MLTRPAASAASVIAIASASFTASGFSQNTGLPAAISSSVVGLVRRVGGRVDRGVELAPGDGVGEAAEGDRDLEGVGEVAGALGVGVDGGDELAAGHQRRIARRGCGPSRRCRAISSRCWPLTGSPPRRPRAATGPSA